MSDYRIAITYPPFSDSFEITIVHPIVKLSLEDYEISEELMKRFSDRAEGIVISGAPGSGKSTLASGLANFYQNQGKIVKTFESPRDLQVDPGITQYGKLEGSFDNTADILLLVRPDYTIFDEVRRQEDFRTFADLRLTGVGMVGVVHANSPLDAIQRFIGKIELGIIPNILDTVVFVKDGRIDTVYDLELKVKVPSGMAESDLARPVIEIRNFADNVLEHEIYTFGEENVIVPVSKRSAGLANFYQNQGKIVKTFESPRDLQVDPGITQYGKLEGSFDNTADILLLVRPDYTIFDEVRRQEDFRTFADLRLTGVGMVGVVHANSPLDAIQRFIGKIELGIIPNILDTVVFVKDGRIDTVYDLELKVKVPSGMAESDLARPVIEIRNFADNVLEHEIYTFGEENVIVPVSKRSQKVGIEKLAEDKIKETFKRYDSNVEVEFLSDNRVKIFVDEQYIPSIIGKGGSNINEIERFLKIHVDVVAKDSEHSSPMTNDLPFTFSESKTALLLTVSREFTSMHADIYVNDKYVASVRIGKKGQIKIPKRSDIARNLMQSASSQNEIQIFLKDF